MNIVQLTTENVLRLNAVSITPDGNLIVIGGKNGQGKTSVLDSIMMALAGKDSKKHPVPLKTGAEKGFTEVELSNGWVVKRTYTAAGGGALTVKSKDGGKYKQANLNEMFSGLTFDGLAWLQVDPTQQLGMLQKIVGLDFTEKNKERKGFYDERTLVNRDIKNIQGRLDKMELYVDAPAEEVSVANLMRTLETQQERNYKNQLQRNNLAELKRDLEEKKLKLAETKKELEAKIQALKNTVAQYKKGIDELSGKIETETKVVDALNDEDDQKTKDQIEAAEKTNAEVRANAEYNQEDELLAEKQKEAETLIGKINSIDQEKENALSEAKFPVEGLSFDESGVLYNGVPFKQASSAEQLRVSVAMGIAMNPELRVLLIRDGSLLDEDNLKMVAEMARESGHQIWIERVGKGDECSIIIEDGMVLEG